MGDEVRDAKDVNRADRGSAIVVLSALLGLSLIIILVLVGLTIGGRAADNQTRAELRRELINRSVRYSCNQIELLKAGEREAARQAYRDLDHTLMLLKIEKTPEIVRAAEESRDKKLQRYKKTACPIPF